MAFIAFCLLFGFVAFTVFKRDERTKAVKEAREKPAAAAFMLIWLIFAAMFFFGIFIPPFGEIELGNSGWKVWNSGLVGFIGLGVVTWFLKLC